MRGRQIRQSAALAAAIGAAGAGLFIGPRVLAQDAAGSLVLTFGVEATLRSEDNPELSFSGSDSAIYQDTRLSFGAVKETDTESFRFGLSTALRMSDESEHDGWRSHQYQPRVNFSYTRRSPDSRLTFSGNYRRDDVDTLDSVLVEDPDDPIFDDTNLVPGSGTRATYNVGVVLETGITAPLGLTLEARRKGRIYSGTNDPDLYDTETDTVAATLRFRFSPVTSGRFRVSHDVHDAENPEDLRRVTDAYSFGVSHQLNQTLSLDTSLGRSSIDREETSDGVRQSDDSDGATFSFGLRQEMVSGSAGLNYDRSFNTNGERDTLMLSRSVDLPRGGLSARVGVSRGESENSVAVGGLTYDLDLLRGGIRAVLERRVATNGSDEDVVTTRAGVDYSRELTTRSSMTLGVDYAMTEDDDDDASGTERERINLRASYNHSLTSDVSLSAGYEHRLRKEDDDDASSDSVFLTLRKNFSVRP